MKSTYMLANPAMSSDFAKQASNRKKACISLMLRVEIGYKEHMSGLYFICSVLFMFYTAAIKFKMWSIYGIVTAILRSSYIDDNNIEVMNNVGRIKFTSRIKTVI